MKNLAMPRARFLFASSAILAAAGCSKTLSGVSFSPSSQGSSTSQSRSGLNIKRSTVWPRPRPDGTIPLLHRGRKRGKLIYELPCVADDSCGSGGDGGTGMSNPSFQFSAGEYEADAWVADNYSELYNGNGDLMWQSFCSSAASDGSNTFEYVAQSQTVSGSMPGLSASMDSDYSFYGTTIHTDTSSLQTTVHMNDGDDTRIICQASTSSMNVVVTVANTSGTASTASTTLNLQGFGTTVGGSFPNMQSSCASAIAQITGMSLAAAAASLLVIAIGCVDGPFALVTCGVVLLLAGAMGTAVGDFNVKKWQNSGCPFSHS
jgi:hypothetical protein